MGRHPYAPADLVAESLQRAPNGSAPSPEPAHHLTPGLCLEPQLTPGAPSSPFSLHHTPHPQVCKLLPLSTPVVYLLSVAQVQSGVPATLLLLTPITVHTADKFLSSKSDHPKPCWGPPSVAPWCLDTRDQPLPLALVHTHPLGVPGTLLAVLHLRARAGPLPPAFILHSLPNPHSSSGSPPGREAGEGCSLFFEATQTFLSWPSFLGPPFLFCTSSVGHPGYWSRCYPDD